MSMALGRRIQNWRNSESSYDRQAVQQSKRFADGEGVVPPSCRTVLPLALQHELETANFELQNLRLAAIGAWLDGGEMVVAVMQQEPPPLRPFLASLQTSHHCQR
jgi:hypothetical protein